MFDSVIRGGTIVDGTGEPAFTGDVAIRDGTIAEVGSNLGPARRTIDADGLLVTPGWIDIHTHYDGQATWDAELAPSSWHGSTTLLLGNCGVGFAPVRRADRERLIELMEGVEDIPGITLSEGLAWDWESFPEYLDALERLPRTIDVAAQVPHHALRVFVMGERGLAREQASADDIREMRRLTAEALAAGAFGFTTSRTDQHKTTAGDFVSGRHAHVDELLGIGAALGERGRGVFGINNDFEDEATEFAWMEALAQQTRRPVWFTLSDRPADPTRWRRLVAQLRRARAGGAPLMGQVVGRPVGVLLGFQTSLNPFSVRDAWEMLEGLTPAQRLARLRDPLVRRQILDSAPSPRKVAALSPSHQAIQAAWDRMYLFGNPPDYEPTVDSTVAAVAARSGRKPEEVAYDHMVGNDANNLLFYPAANYCSGDHSVIRELMLETGTFLGLGDGGAHCSTISDCSVSTYMLTHWTRDRLRGAKLPLEWVVHKQTAEPASLFGFDDRGRIAAGLRADINLIDYDRLHIHAPDMAYDLPAGGRRLLQRATGYVATLVDGLAIIENGVATGERPGRLVRAGA